MNLWNVFFIITQAKVESGSRDGNAPSRVVHVRHLPDDVTEKEVQSLAILFGRVEKLLMMQSKGQALLEMAELDDAVKLVDFHSTVPANVRYTHKYIMNCIQGDYNIWKYHAVVITPMGILLLLFKPGACRTRLVFWNFQKMYVCVCLYVYLFVFP